MATSKTHLIGIRTFLAQTRCLIKNCFLCEYISELQRRQWQPTPVLLLGKSHGWRSLVGCSPSGCKELDRNEQLHFHFSLSCIGEGNGHPLQCSCLETPRDGEAWWAAVYGVTQSRTRLMWLSSSSSATSGFTLFVCFLHLPLTQILWETVQTWLDEEKYYFLKYSV